MKEWSERFDREPSIFESRPRAAFLMESKLPSSKVKGDIPAKTKRRRFLKNNNNNISTYEKFTIINIIPVSARDIDTV